MITSFFAPFWALIGRVPKEIWYAIALVLALLFYGNWQYDRGKQVVLDRLAAEAAETAKKAAEARLIADDKAGARADEFEAQQEKLKKVIDDAQTSDSNALDGLFSGLSEAD